VNLLAVIRFDQLRFPEVEKDDGLSDIADTHWFVVLIQNQDLAAQPSI
jgi:hypothetical protein